MNCSTTRKSKIIYARILKFSSVYGVKICSVNLGRETTFLTLIQHAIFYHGNKRGMPKAVMTTRQYSLKAISS